MRRRWKRIRYRLEWIGLLVATKLVPLLPRRVCLALARALGFLMSIFDRRGRAVALANLEVAFGERLSILQRRKIARESFQHFARAMLDFLWSPRLTRDNFSRYIELENLEETVRAGGPERSIMIACYHYSNFEWLSLAGGYLGLPGTIIMQAFKNSLLDPIFKKLREQSGHQLVPRERGIMRLYKVLRRKGRTALLVDLTVPPTQGAVAIDCFGLKTSVTSAHAWLHEHTGVPVIPAHCEPLSNGRYRVVFHRKIDNAHAMTHQQFAQACWDSFEPCVRKNPAPWLWMYKHWRYRPSEAMRPYPFYANVEPRFDKMVQAAERDGREAALRRPRSTQRAEPAG
ncbi:MAG: lysophospholipid acyltransferase family protein [Chthoniobacterales bacterium]